MLLELHKELGIPEDFAHPGSAPLFEEASELVEVGPNLVGRMQRLAPAAAGQWLSMVDAAAGHNVALMIVSGFRGYEYQAGLIRRKLDSGQVIEDILCVNAAPGYSEHHTGRAVDVATPGSRPLTEEFEDTDAFRWLSQHAETYGFSMSYPRDNPHGFIYEPWHWAFRDG
ncbi:MAG: M15 family metallopeptidase [Woeseiaceae bacterium]|nr:M15 family metallopeptidase [Woeseiaceae bacterium]